MINNKKRKSLNKNIKTKMNNEKGITLVALVVTIVVLIILAGVSISLVLGENGIITQAQIAKQQSQKSSAIEQAKIDILAWQTEQMQNNKNAELTDSKVKEILTGKDYVKDGTLDDEGFKNKDGDTVFKYSDLYKKTESEGTGKKIAELYDGINNPEDEGYDENAMHIGDWVNYTAGSWGENEGVATPTSSTPFTFGGYNGGQSRDENANGTYKGAREGATYEGWRIWDISEDKLTMTLVSAGCPEEFYLPQGNFYGCIGEYILTGNINNNINEYTVVGYDIRDWSIYKNVNQYANNAKALTNSNLSEWYMKYIDSNTNDINDANLFISNRDNKLISLIENQCYYWTVAPCFSGRFQAAYAWDGMTYMNPDNRYNDDYEAADISYGVRVLVDLTEEVKFEKNPKTLEKDGFTYNKWIIKSK